MAVIISQIVFYTAVIIEYSTWRDIVNILIMPIGIDHLRTERENGADWYKIVVAE